MHIVGIIAEYNPFHLGHAYQINEIQRHMPEAVIVAVISGGFTQRGLPALLDKWERARLAVLGGCDLVLELPFAFACHSAQDFARGGVQLLSRLGIIDTLAFGAETNSLELLAQAARSMESPSFQQQLHKKIANGLAYASAVEKTLSQEASSAFIRKPNNILALEYLRALRDAPALSPLLIQRQGAGYHSADLKAPLPSASALRLALYEGRLDEKAAKLAAPPATAERLTQLRAEELPQMARLYPALQLALLRQSAEELKRIYGMEEGLENRLQEAAFAPSYESFIQRAVSRRYPATRLQRLALHMLLSLDRERTAAFESSGRKGSSLWKLRPPLRPPAGSRATGQGNAQGHQGERRPAPDCQDLPLPRQQAAQKKSAGAHASAADAGLRHLGHGTQGTHPAPSAAHQ